MIFQPFDELFPEIARQETRTIAIPEGNSFKLPADEYGFFEAYCNDPKCDCRRVFFNVFSRHRKKLEAVIFYGWEDVSFYRKWIGIPDFDAATNLAGPGLNDSSLQSSIAPSLLTACSTLLLKDENYVKRIINHYTMFKDKIKLK